MTDRRHTLSILDCQLRELTAAFSNALGHERAAYLFCAKASTPSETRLIVREVAIVPPEHISGSSPEHVSISSLSYVPAICKADKFRQSLVLVHSHPTGFPHFSKQDDREEAHLFRTAFLRAPNGPHGSLILIGGNTPSIIGRVWLSDEVRHPMARIRVVGRRMRLFDHVEGDHAPSLPPWTDRQVRAFGKETQALLSRLHVGVVGNGGTGSAVADQLIRLGVGQITAIDEQALTDTNVTRVHGSGLEDTGTPKASIVKRHAEQIGTGTLVVPVQGSVCDLEVASILRDCDIIFACTDDYLGRVILNRLSVWYFIPVFDMAVIIDSDGGVIREVTGRITTLIPGNACLRCRERIPQAKLDAQQLKRFHPEEYAARVREGYAPELGDPDPAVVMFTTGVAARAVTEFIHMLTGFMGEHRTATEVLERFHETEVRVNSRPGEDGCYCSTPSKWGKGDERRFLDLSW